MQWLILPEQQAVVQGSAMWDSFCCFSVSANVGVGSVSNQIIVTKIICTCLASFLWYFRSTFVVLHKDSQSLHKGEENSNSLILRIVTILAHICPTRWFHAWKQIEKANHKIFIVMELVIPLAGWKALGYGIDFVETAWAWVSPSFLSGVDNLQFLLRVKIGAVSLPPLFVFKLTDGQSM